VIYYCQCWLSKENLVAGLAVNLQTMQGGFYAVQEKAWINESIMKEWAESVVLGPYVKTAPVRVLWIHTGGAMLCQVL
jgi:hypothetical protein